MRSDRRDSRWVWAVESEWRASEEGGRDASEDWRDCFWVYSVRV